MGNSDPQVLLTRNYRPWELTPQRGARAASEGLQDSGWSSIHGATAFPTATAFPAQQSLIPPRSNPGQKGHPAAGEPAVLTPVNNH